MSTFISWCTFFVFNSAWQLIALVAVTGLLLRMFPRMANGLQYRLWVGCFLLAISVPVISTYLALAPAHSPSAVQVNDANRWKVPRQPDRGRLTLHLTEVSVTHSDWPVLSIVAGLYLACLAFALSRFLLRMNITRRVVALKNPLTLGVADFELRQDRVNDRGRTVEFFESSELQSPATVSWPQPMIMLPPTFELMPGEEKAAVIAHELAHVQRHDFEMNLLFEALSLALCYHPAMPWLKRRIAECREAVCDDLAAEATSGREAYAAFLLNVAQRTAAHASFRTSLSLGISDTELEGRIMKLVHAPLILSNRRRSLLHALCAVVLASSSFGILHFSLHPPTVQAAGLPAFSFDPSQTFDTLTPKAQRKQAPDFTLVDNNGKKVTLSNYKGKVVLLDFWATWCGGCKLEIPWYMGFDRKYRKDGLAVIGVSMDEKGWDAVRPFLAKKKDDETGGMIAMQYPIVIGNDELAGRFGLTSMPMTLLIDKDGKIAVSHTGVVDKDNFENNIKELLK